MVFTSPMKRKRRVTVTVRNMEAFENVLLNASEFIKGRLFFVSLNTDIRPKSTPSVHYFAVDTELCYDNFYLDFGPLNLAMLYHYCVKLKRKLSSPVFHNKKIVHYTGADSQKRANAAFLIGSYAVINLSYDPEKAFDVLNHDSKREYIDFRDASLGEPYRLSLLDCLKAVKKAHIYNFFNFDDFDFIEYEHYECVENGDFNWIIPNKFIAFCGPHNRSKLDKGYPIHSPETYFAYFRRHKVTTIVRLNKKAYDSNKFVQAGFDHKDLYFVDGGTPSDKILQQFISICEASDGAIAVHCKAGLGRTGSLIACYIMKHWKFTAEEAIAWIRVCRPGSIIGQQQSWLQEKQKIMWEAGDIYRKRKGITQLMKCQYGIYSLAEMKRKRSQDNVTGIMKKVDCMEIKDPTEELDFEDNNRIVTQGDKLNEIKAQRNKVKPLQTTTTERLRRVHIRSSTSTTTNQTLLRGGKLIPNSSTRISGSTSSRVVTKRIVDPKEAQVKRGTRKLPNPNTTNGSSDKCQLNEKRQIKNSITRLNKNGVIYQNGNNVKNNNTLEEKSIKRVKRALVSEKDRCASSRSVKVLRRSNVLALSLKEERSEKIELGKIHLPSVKLNKTL